MRLSEAVRIDNRFEKSVNLLLDLNNPSRIRLYIPTHSSAAILEDYLRNTTEPGRSRATVLIGPYGKGKSHLLLVLLAVLSGGDRGDVMELVKRIEKVSPGFKEAAKKAEGSRFLPVIVNPGQENLNQSFIKSLFQALKRDGLSEVAPSSYFTEAVRSIRNWKEYYPTVYKAFCELSEVGSVGAEAFEDALSRMDNETLDIFRKIYPELTAGSVFNPVIEDSAIDVYRSVNRRLCEAFGYSGIYIIFDEFSKYVEGHAFEGFSADMKTLQDMCELADSSKEEQIHITCVAHKSVSSYKNSLPKEVLNAYRGVEGRITEKQFIVSSQNNYELIADALIKTDRFEMWAKESEAFRSVSDAAYLLPVFRTLFTDADYREIVAHGCYPLSPLTAMLLLSLSEKVAQNERTVFTFLTNKSGNGLESFIESAQGMEYANADIIYDYFSPIFRDSAEEHVHNEWLKAEYALSKTDDAKEAAFIKALAVIRMVNKQELPASEKIIRIASGMDDGTGGNVKSALENNGLIVFRSRTGAYEFRNGVSVDIEQAIADCAATKYANVDVAGILNSCMRQKYLLPKRHNHMYSMTRYYNCLFMNAVSYLALGSFGFIEWNNRPDGVLIFVLPDEKVSEDDIRTHTISLSDPRIMVCMPSSYEDISKKVRTYGAVSFLKDDQKFIEDNQVVKRELENMAEDLAGEIDAWILKHYFEAAHVFSERGAEEIGPFGLARVVSDACDRAYPHSPRINNELINRHEISSQTVKARNRIVSDILEGNNIDKYEAATGPEATIGRAVLLRTGDDPGVCLVRDEIRRFVFSCTGNKIPFRELTDKLMAPPYGMRAGVIPVYIAEALAGLDEENMPVIYFSNKEMPINADIIGKVMAKPADYSLYIEKETVEKEGYLENLEKTFSDYLNSCRELDTRSRLARIACTMQVWYRALPQAAKTVKLNIGGISAKKVATFRKLFAGLDINPREVIFEGIPKAFGTDSLDVAAINAGRVKRGLNAYVSELKKEAEGIIREELGIAPNSDLTAGLKEWYATRPDIVRHSVFTGTTGDFLSALKHLEPGDPAEITNRLSRILTGMYAEDWIDGVPDELAAAIADIRSEIEGRMSGPLEADRSVSFIDESGNKKGFVYRYKDSEVSPVGTFFRNALDDMLDEYGDSVDTNEKIGILMDAVRRLMG